MANLKDNKALQLLGIMNTGTKKNAFATGNDEYYEDEEDIEHGALGLPPPNATYIDNNNTLLQPQTNNNNNILPHSSSSPPIPPTPPKPPPPPKPFQSQPLRPPQPPNGFNISSNGHHINHNHNNNDDDDDDENKDLGTSDDYINKQLQRVMDGLNIPKHARAAMFALSKSQKLTMIQQYNRKQNMSELPNVTNVKRQNQPKPSGPHTNSKLIPIMGKNISAPTLTSGISPIGTIPISEARQKLQRSQTPNSLNIYNKKRYSDITSIKNQSYLKLKNDKQRHLKSKSNLELSYKPPPVPLDAIKAAKANNNNDDSRLSLPPPVPVSIKKKYGSKPGTDSNRSSIKSFESEDEIQEMQKMECLMEGDDEYEYYEEEEEDDEYDKEPEPIKANHYKPSIPKPLQPEIKKKKTKNVKVKLRIGSEIEVYSNSKKRWIDGNIVKIKGKLICVAYGPNGGTQKWLEAASKNFRPKMANIKKVKLPSIPSLDPARTSDASTNEAKVDCDGNDDVDYMNNPTPQRFRKSVAFQQKKQIKIKLRVGSLVEVFSVSKNQWIDGKLTGIKKDLIRVAYGKGLNTEKWLRANSKQFRPKLDMVDAAIHDDKNNNNNNKNNKQKKNNSKHANISSKYSIDSDDESIVGTHNVQPMFIPQHGPNGHGPNDNQQRGPPPPPNGAYVTHSLRREQYQQFSVESIKGINNKRGDLKIKIHGALQLRNNGNSASIKVAEHTLKTKKVASDENPVWKEILTFSNFRPHIGKTGVITISNKVAIMGEKIIGSAEFELPIVFNRQEKMTIDITDNKNKLSGILVLEQCVVDAGK